MRPTFFLNKTTTPLKSNQEQELILLKPETLKAKLRARLGAYEEDFKRRNTNSFISDNTRQTHLEEMKTSIERLNEEDFNSVTEFLLKLHVEMKYAKTKNGKNYLDALTSMLALIIGNYDDKTIVRLTIKIRGSIRKNEESDKINESVAFFSDTISQILVSQSRKIPAFESVKKGYILGFIGEEANYYSSVLTPQISQSPAI